MKMTTAAMMTALHRENRVKWVRRFIGKGDHFWNKVFLVTKRNSTSTDLTATYAIGMIYGNMKDVFKKTKWRSISHGLGRYFPYGVSPLVFLNGNLDFCKYCATLDQALLPLEDEMYG